MNLLRDSLMASLRTGKLLKIFKKPSGKSPRIFMTTEKNKDTEDTLEAVQAGLLCCGEVVCPVCNVEARKGARKHHA